MYEFKLPEVGENIEAGTVVSIAVKAGDTITKDQDLLELETDKASLPIPSPVNGTVSEVLINEGDEVKIGQLVMKIEASETAPVKEEAKGDSPLPNAAPKESQETPTPQAQTAPIPAAPKPASSTNFVPRANVDIPSQSNVPAAPAVRRLARELGVNISKVPGSGPGGRVSKDDVKAFTKQIITAQVVVAATPSRPLPDFTKFGETKREAMNNIRKKTVEHMSHCWNTIPHVTQFDKADITDLEAMRKEKSTDERKLTVTPFLLKIMAKALKEFPQFNASVDPEAKEIILKSYVNIGVAVDTERGLLVPVVKDIDKKGIFEITDELNAAAERARTKKTSLDELQGGSMTLTNLGGIGGYAFTPIVNWPEVCILGVSRGGFEPVWDKTSKTFVPRFKIPFSLSYDHRLIDGADAARFLRWICINLEKPFDESEF